MPSTPSPISSATSPTEDLCAKVFEAISPRFTHRASDIAKFAATKYSFEEWLNWEAYGACCDARDDWEVHPKPGYSRLCDPTCKDYGDLLVRHLPSGKQALVEIGLVHDGTGDKWLYKLDWDMEKLARKFDAKTLPMQIIVLVSGGNIRAADNWQKWLAKMKCWGRTTNLEALTPLPPRGEMVVRGWVATCS